MLLLPTIVRHELCAKLPTLPSTIATTSSRRLIHQSASLKWQVFEDDRYFTQGEEPWKRVKHTFWYGLRRAARRYREAKNDPFQRHRPVHRALKNDVFNYELYPRRSEILIIGGGLTGSSIAFFLKQLFCMEEWTVSIIESTENFSKTRSLLGSGVISQQFSQPEMVDLANFSAEFLRHAGDHLKILDNDPPDINFLPVGLMHLARTEEEAEQFKAAWKTQVERGVHVALLSREELKKRFSFMNFDDVVLGTYGLENEGIFDTWRLLAALREKNITLGVRYYKGDFEGVCPIMCVENEREQQRHGAFPTREANLAALSDFEIRGANIRPQFSGASPRQIQCYKLINAAGPWAGEVARRAGVGGQGELMQVPLPIVCTRRTNFIVHCPEVPLQMPILMDPGGVFCRPDNVGHNFVCGRNPTKKDAVKMLNAKPDEDPPIDYNEFYTDIWPTLVRRVPAFKSAKVINAWYSYEDVNLFDNTPIIGEHLVHKHFLQVTGLGGYGPQMSLAIGKMISERIFEYAYMTVNLRKYDMRRIMHGKRHSELFRCV